MPGRPIVTFTTDFGTRDTYVAEMKAAVLALARDVHLVDVTHEIAAHDIVEGALALSAAAPRFPPGTIHVAVVDPGVGTTRRGLVIEAGGQRFVGPDNGLFSVALATAGWRAWSLRSRRLRHPVVSRTFHGRDVFAPAAAHLALGVEPSRFGPSLRDPVRLDLGRAVRRRGQVTGRVIHVDRFGNLVTSIRSHDLTGLAVPLVTRIGQRSLPLVATYGSLPAGGVGALLGSQDRLEIAVREGSAAEVLGAERGARVAVRSRSGAAAR